MRCWVNRHQTQCSTVARQLMNIGFMFVPEKQVSPCPTTRQLASAPHAISSWLLHAQVGSTTLLSDAQCHFAALSPRIRHCPRVCKLLAHQTPSCPPESPEKRGKAQKQSHLACVWLPWPRRPAVAVSFVCFPRRLCCGRDSTSRSSKRRPSLSEPGAHLRQTHKIPSACFGCRAPRASRPAMQAMCVGGSLLRCACPWLMKKVLRIYFINS